MITIRTWLKEGCYWIEASGHAAATTESKEHTQVCSAVSTLLVTLWQFTAEQGTWDGDGSGYMRVWVTRGQLIEHNFVLFGLRLVAENYPGHIEFVDGEP